MSDPYANPAGDGMNGDILTGGTIAGGAVYQENADLTFIDCKFMENSAYAAYSYDSVGLSSLTEEDEFRIYAPGGAIYVAAGNQITLDRCRFVENISEAVYVVGNCVVDVNATEFSRNEASEVPADSIFISNRGFIDGQIVYGDTIVASHEGGAVYIGRSCPEVMFSKCEFQSNSASGNGGAIRLLSDADFVDCSFAGNRAGESGGAIEAYRDTGNSTTHEVLTLNIESSIFSGNYANEGFYGQGGGVHFEDVNAVVTDSYFLNNRAKSGGGLFVTAGTIEIRGGSISGNTAIGGSGVDLTTDVMASDYFLVSDTTAISSLLDTYYLNRGNFAKQATGAGIDVGGGLVLATANAAIDNCMFTDNSATGAKGSGGALCFYADGGTVDHIVRNCLFADNSAYQDGGAISVNLFSQPKILNSTFADNTAGNLGGAVFCDWTSKATLSDSIFEKNSKYAIAEVDFADTMVQNSLFYQNSQGDCGLLDSVTGNVDAKSCQDLSATNVTGDPLFIGGPLGELLPQSDVGRTGGRQPGVERGQQLRLRRRPGGSDHADRRHQRHRRGGPGLSLPGPHHDAEVRVDCDSPRRPRHREPDQRRVLRGHRRGDQRGSGSGMASRSVVGHHRRRLQQRPEQRHHRPGQDGHRRVRSAQDHRGRQLRNTRPSSTRSTRRKTATSSSSRRAPIGRPSPTASIRGTGFEFATRASH